MKILSITLTVLSAIPIVLFGLLFFAVPFTAMNSMLSVHGLIIIASTWFITALYASVGFALIKTTRLSFTIALVSSLILLVFYSIIAADDVNHPIGGYMVEAARTVLIPSTMIFLPALIVNFWIHIRKKTKSQESNSEPVSQTQRSSEKT